MLNFEDNSILISKAQSKELTGTWINEKFKISYTLREKGTVIFDQGGSSVFISSYELDNSKNPAWLDFTIKRGDISMVIPALFEFIDENTIKIEQCTPGGEHPTEFSKEGNNNFRNQHVLKRI